MRRTPSTLLSLSKLSSSNLSTTNLLTLISCIVVCTALSFAAAPDRITGSIGSGQMVELARSLHPRVEPQYDQGAVDPQSRFGYVTLLTSPSASQQRALDKLMADQQNPSSSNYHKWLTPAQYADRFGLSQNDIDKITTWLKAQGFTVVSVGGGRNSIIFSGTAAQIEAAFQTQLHRYNIDGEEHFSNATPVKIPAAWSGVVTGVRGLNSFHWKAMGVKNQLHRNYYFSDLKYSSQFIAPGDAATIYDINPLYNASTPIDGTGQKLAVIGETDIYLADINNFRSGFGLNPISGCTTNTNGVVTACNSTNFEYVLVGTDPGAPDTCGDLAEADLDIEWSGAIARNAQIVYVNAPALWNSQCTAISGGGVENALAVAINPPSGPPVAPVISMSYGICELYANVADETELQQANVEGVTILNSSGDTGAAGCDNFYTPTSPPNLALYGPAVNYPASSQYVTGVGGSEVPYADFTATYWGMPNPNPADGHSALGYVPEEAWNDDYEFGAYCLANPSNTFCATNGITSQLTAQEALGLGASGGGPSNCFTVNVSFQCTGGFPQPSWQTVTISGQASARFVPDVSLLATPNFPGYIFCTQLSELGLSGTGSTCAPGGAAGITNALSLTDSSGNPFPSVVGGTSVSTPEFAGMVALLNQYFQGAASPGLGNVNPMLYKLAKASSNFHQLTTGNNQEYCVVGQPSNQPLAWQCQTGILGFLASNSDTTTGYNLVTGLGSVDLNNLVTAWAAARTASTITITASPTSISVGQSVTLTATVVPSTAVGQVTFYVTGASSSLGLAPLNSSGVATLTTAGSSTTLPVGADSINAFFPGDGYNMTSTTTTPVVVTVAAPAFTLANTGSASHTVLAGQTTLTYTFLATPTSSATFANAVSFSCAFSPSDTTLTSSICSYSVNGGTPSTSATIPAGSSASTVTMTVTTAGPNPGTGAALRYRADNRSPWLPVTLPIAGVVMLGLMRGKVSRKVSKRSAIALLCFSLALLGFMLACGGGSSTTTTPVSVTVTPSSTVQLYANEAGNAWLASATQQQFSATVNNSTNQNVTWAVAASADGTVSSTGLYTAPATVPSPATVSVTATAAADTTKSGSGTVDILTPTAVGTFTVTVTATEATTSVPATPAPTLTVD